MLGVQPNGLGIECFFRRSRRLLEIHDRVGSIDALQRKRVDQLLPSHFFAIVFRRPSHKAQEVDERLRQKSRIPISRDAHHRPVPPLGELRSIRSDQQGKMRELRSLPPGRLEDQHMLVGIRKMILPTDNMADAQIDVIRARRYVIGRHPIRPQQREVFDVVGSLDLLSVNRVRKAD